MTKNVFMTLFSPFVCVGKKGRRGNIFGCGVRGMSVPLPYLE
jgi:hypothetical protein